MSERRTRLIVNADDFGYNAGINAGVIEAHESGIVTSASMMVRWPGAPAAAEYGAANPRLAVGLHLDIGQWEYVDGEWRATYQRASRDDRAGVEAELRAQLEVFRELMGANPTHVDSHQHVHNHSPVAEVAGALADELGVPLRGRDTRYCGDFYGQTGTGEPFPEGIAIETLLALLARLPPGVTELGCHPGIDVGDEVYARECEEEVRVLCDPRVREALEREGVELISFADTRRAPGQ